jgi:hypothetical protein
MSWIFLSCSNNSITPKPIVWRTRIFASSFTSSREISIFWLFIKSRIKSLPILKNVLLNLLGSKNSSSFGLCSDKTLLAILKIS